MTLRTDTHRVTDVPEAAHAASEYPDANDSPTDDAGMEMLGMLVPLAFAVVGVIALLAAVL